MESRGCSLNPGEVPAMQRSQTRITLWRIMAAIAILAMVFGLDLRGIPVTIAIAGPLCGAVLNRAMGGRGIVGGALGGGLAWTVHYGLIFVHAVPWIRPSSNILTGSLALDPVGTITFFGTLGAVSGAALGWYVQVIATYPGFRDEPEPPGRRRPYARSLDV
jgi:hypothetical protein